MRSPFRAPASAVAVALVLLALAAPSAAAFAPTRVVTNEDLVLVGSSVVSDVRADQGLASVTRNGTTTLLTRGSGSIPTSLRRAGWTHIGDPDSRNGYVLDAYQGDATSRVTLFALTAPDGRRTLYTHTLTAGETFHNSFAAIAPGSAFFVGGGWGTMSRLLVFPMPTRASPPALPLAAVITLDRPVRNVQGCAFESATALLCSTNDPHTDLFGVARQILRVQLSRPLDGRSLSAHVSLVTSVPVDPSCAATPEAEGIDVHGSTVSVLVNSGCNDVATIYRYARTA